MEDLVLRQWRNADLDAFAEMNADPEVMRHFPALLSREQSAAFVERQRGLIEERGWGLWALEVGGEFAGFVGLAVPRFEAAFTPCVEIGWRLRREFWGRGLACRAAQQALSFGFETLSLPEIVSFTATTNSRSIRLMERLGLTRNQVEDFDHPMIPECSPLRRHVLYRMKAAEWVPAG